MGDTCEICKKNPAKIRIGNHSYCFYCHNKMALRDMGLDDSFYTSDKLEFYGEVNFMKAGILYADLINTVSETYVKEIKTAEWRSL